MSKLFLSCLCILLFSGCGVYSLSGASIEGKTINIHTFQNQASNIAPSLATNFSNKVRNEILSQTGLTPVNSGHADYDLKCTITQYSVAISGMQSQTEASKNRLTITVQVDFTNTLDEKSSFKQSFSRFADFPANQQLQSVEASLIDQIGDQLAQDIFNRAFVNW